MRHADRLGARARGDPRRGRDGAASRHELRRAARGRRRASCVEELAAAMSRTEAGFPALRPNDYRDAWCGQVLPDRVGDDRPRRRLGPPPPRPRRPRVHRPARPHRPRPARLQPGRGGRRLRARPRAALRGRDHAPPARSSGARPRRQPRAADRRVRGPGRRGDAARRRRDAAVRDRVVLGRGGGGGAPALPLPRPAPRPHARGARAAPPGRPRDARVLRRRGLRRGRDADALALDPGGRARLPGPVRAASRARSTRCRSRRSSSSSS